MNRFSDITKELLIRAGWYEGRNVFNEVHIPKGFIIFPVAIEVLQEFGNLHIGVVGAGKQCATSDVEVNPCLGEGLEILLAPHETKLGRRLYPIGEIHNGHGALILDEVGEVYLFFDDLMPYATSFKQALEMLMLGLKPAA